MVTINDNGPGSPRQIALSGFGGADFTVNASRADALVPVLKGTNSVNYNVGLNGIAGAPIPTSGDVQLSCSGLGTATCSFNPASIPVASIISGGGSVLTLGNLSSVGGATFNFTITATLGTQIASIAENLAFADFTIGASQSSVTVGAGQNATYQLSVSPLNGLNNSISFSCSNLPSHAACSFSPSPLTMDGRNPSTTTLTVTTKVTSSAAIGPILGLSPTVCSASILPSLSILSSVAFGLLTFAFARRRRWQGIAILIFAGITCISCGGGGGGGSTPTPPSSGGTTLTTPSGTYTITVIASDGTLQHNVQVGLVVN